MIFGGWFILCFISHYVEQMKFCRVGKTDVVVFVSMKFQTTDIVVSWKLNLHQCKRIVKSTLKPSFKDFSIKPKCLSYGLQIIRLEDTSQRKNRNAFFFSGPPSMEPFWKKGLFIMLIVITKRVPTITSFRTI